MNKTPEEIKKSLERCSDKSSCEYCHISYICDLEAEALAYIRQLEADNARLQEAYNAISRDLEYMSNRLQEAGTEDAISREAVMQAIDRMDNKTMLKYAIEHMGGIE